MHVMRQLLILLLEEGLSPSSSVICQQLGEPFLVVFHLLANPSGKGARPDEWSAGIPVSVALCVIAQHA